LLFKFNLYHYNLERRQRELEGDSMGGGGAGGGGTGGGGGGGGGGETFSEGASGFAAEGEGRVVKNRKAAGGAAGTGTGGDIEDTKREIQQALSRIDQMQKKQKDLTD
jgi:hypothetical protein